jgi:hypothetical protein
LTVTVCPREIVTGLHDVGIAAGLQVAELDQLPEPALVMLVQAAWIKRGSSETSTPRTRIELALFAVFLNTIGSILFH